MPGSTAWIRRSPSTEPRPSIARWCWPALVLPLFAADCRDVDCVCTAVFVRIDVQVTDPGGAPATAVEIQATLVRTGEVLQVPQTASEPGRYTVIDDGSVHRLLQSGDHLQVVGTKNATRFEAEFVVRPDGPCGCHVQKLSGPETAMLAYLPD